MTKRKHIHLSSLGPMNEDQLFLEKEHPAPKKAKISNQEIVWIYEDKEPTIVTDSEFDNLVNNGEWPENAKQMRFGKSCFAELSSYDTHMYTQSCVLQGNRTDSSEKDFLVEIKIRYKNCLGQCEFNAAQQNISGCLPVLMQWTSGNWLIFVRQKPQMKLSKLLLKKEKPENINIYEKLSSLASITNRLHLNSKFYVRSIISDNIVFNNMKEIRYEEFGTIKLMDKPDNKTSDIGIFF